jgi:hypothetical protein
MHEKLSGDVISRACFGSNYSKGEELFLEFGALREHLSTKFFYNGIPGMRFDHFLPKFLKNAKQINITVYAELMDI